MSALVWIAVFIGGVYLTGCVAAYRAVSADRGEYTLVETVKYTLWSWLTVLIGMMGRVQ